MKILITGGATREPIDPVRFISNMSTGKTGAALANFMLEHKNEVVYLAGLDSQKPHTKIETIEFQSFEDLNERMKDILSHVNFDVVIHLAAVSDFSIDSVLSNGETLHNLNSRKIESTDDIQIHLKKNFKILDRIKEYSKNKNLVLIAFKLTSTATQDFIDEAVQKLISSSGANFVVQNDLSEIKPQHKFNVYNRDMRVEKVIGAVQLAQTIEKLIREAV